MSKDKIRPLLKAVADLPEVHTGFVLDIVNQLRGEDSAKVRLVVGQALTSLRTELSSEEDWHLLDPFDPAQYFTTRDGLWVSPGFTSRILSAHNKQIEKRGLEGVTYVDLLKDMYDSNIINEYLGGKEEARKHAFTPDQVASLIGKQKDSKEGEMLNNSHANIFYVIGEDDVLFAVCVRWNRDHCNWTVYACDLDGRGGWNAGNRVFRNKN